MQNPFNTLRTFSLLGAGGLLLFFLSTAPSNAQSSVIKYARQIIDTLCAPGMHGRGYVNMGDSIAADYLKNEFSKLNLSPVGTSVYQHFYFHANIFPDEMELSINKQRLLPGKDFIVAPSSSGRKEKLKVLYFDKQNVSSFSWEKRHKYESGLFSKRALLVDTIGFSPEQKKLFGPHFTDVCWNCPPILYITDKKFTWDIETNNDQFCYLTIQRNSLPKDPKKARFNISNFSGYFYSKNIVTFIKGTQYPDSFIVFSAHYDHLGRMGRDTYFPGANDNASGCAMLLSLAKYYSEHPPKYSIAFMAFGAEEVGLVGSKHYVEKPLFPLKQIKFLVNMDIMGTGDEGIKVVNATEHKAEFDKLVAINKEKNYIPSVNPRGKAANSDHYFFEEAGVKTFFIYTLGGIKAYHDIYDRPETLPLTEFEDIYKLLIDFTEELQK